MDVPCARDQWYDQDKIQALTLPHRHYSPFYYLYSHSVSAYCLPTSAKNESRNPP